MVKISISKTPILDLEVPMPRNPWAGDEPLTARNVVILVASALGVIGLTVVVLILSPRVAHLFEQLDHLLDHFFPHDSVLSTIVFPLSLLAAWFLCVFVHELGHLIGGKLAGYKLEMFLVWPFLFTWNEGKRSFRVLNRSDLLGFVAFHISDLQNFRSRYSLFVVGGPTANLVFAAACASLWRAVQHPAARELLGGTAVISFGLGVLNLIPFRSGVHSTDGSKLFMLAFQVERMKRLQALIQLRTLTLSGISAKDWPQEVVTQAIAPGAENVPERYHLFLFAYIWASAKDNSELAAEYLEMCLQCLRSAGRSTRDFLAVESAIFQAWHGRDPEKCKGWKARIRSLKSLSGYSKLRLKICEACLEGRYEDAISEVDSFAGALGKKSSSPALEVLKRAWLDWKSQIEQRAALSKAAPKT